MGGRGQRRGEREEREEGGRKGRRKGKEENRQRKGRREGRKETLHKLSQVSCLHCLQQLLWPRGKVGDNCTQVVMATAEPHTLTLNRTRGTTLLGGVREREEVKR